MSEDEQNSIGDFLVIVAAIVLVGAMLSHCDLRVRVESDAQTNTPAR